MKARRETSTASQDPRSKRPFRLQRPIAGLGRPQDSLAHDRLSRAILALQELRCYTWNMNLELLSHQDLSDDELLAQVTRLAAAERVSTVQLIAALAEVDSRRLYLGQGCASLFVYCTSILRLSEHAAYGRIEAARAARRLPILLEMLGRGELTLTSLCLIAPHLSDSNHFDVLARVRHRSKREVEDVVASLRPRPDVPAMVRKLPERRAVAEAAVGPTPPRAERLPPPAPSATVCPLAPERYKLQVTISAETRAKLQRAQDLLRPSLPSGDVASILDLALDMLVADLGRKKAALVMRPRTAANSSRHARHIPAAVRRAVWKRDGGSCAFAGAGRRCNETAFLEFHHVTPFAAGGEATAENIQLRCRAHNQYEAELFFGEPFIAREREPGYVN